ncbi:MAG: MFS transporter [Roseiflexus sp.]|nr:MFS transporter [Roseiflexus sp.]MBO9336542.1 MFS transporter [Roseiflexus sp.]MBO9364243.1 MFS transporter [Roseiflexus sp.]MBO9382519.1 MFS transporter [Roseiflexus sp.]MBO9389947.1 MFS transporter [Roseiflexus sp.]
MSTQRTILITAGLMLSLFLASMESTVVSTGMPTIVSQLGGLESYSWVFTAFMLASTTTVPLYGKLSDLFGRRPVFVAAMAIFLTGSALCGLAATMPQLIAFRTIQGIGAGGLLPLVFIIIGDLFSLEQRARLQGLFSGVWGISSIAGPLLGGFIVDQASWRWIFWINIIPGLAATAIVWFAWIDRPRAHNVPPRSIDYAGALLLTAGAVTLLMSLTDLGASWALPTLAGALALFGALVWVERRASDPVLPIGLFRDRMFLVACGHGILAGCAVFGGATFVPLYVQGVLGTSATEAGAALMPMLLAWVFSSILGTRLLLWAGYHTIALAGMAALVIGAFPLMFLDTQTNRLLLLISLGLMGFGMGFSIPAFLIAVQSTVERSKLGTATSTLQFSRSIGGAFGIGIMGVILSATVVTNLVAAGLDASTSLNNLIDSPGSAPVVQATLRDALSAGIRGVFVVGFIASVLGLLVTLLAPRGQIAQMSAERERREGVVHPAAEHGR